MKFGACASLLLSLFAGNPLPSPRTPAVVLFTEADVGLPALSAEKVFWGDFDGDGHLDLAVDGYDGAYFARIYRNNGGTFVDTGAGIFGYQEGPLIAGDYDNDGDLDLVIGGWAGTGTGTRMYRNNGAGPFTWLDNGLRGMKGADGAWFDYDNDGDLDLLVAGESYDTPQGDYAQIYRNDGGGVFTLAVDLSGMYLGHVSVGDFDNDGLLDVAITGRTTTGTKIYRNDGNGGFTNLGLALPNLIGSAIVWGDYDNDGLLDFALCGRKDDLTFFFEIYHNDGSGVFSAINAGLPVVASGDLHWGDFDNDGDLDLLVTGLDSGGTPVSLVYRNDAGVFVDAGAGLTGVFDQSSAAWGDYDDDGRLDIVLACRPFTGGDSTQIVKVYHNNAAVANTAPSAPGGLSAAVLGNRTTFSWSASTDAQTPSPGLTYNLRVGTTPGGQQVMAAMSDLATGKRRIPAMGNVQHNLSWSLKNLPAGTYYFSVQAVDTGFMGSGWAAEGSIAVTVIDTTAPTVVSTVPADGSLNVNPATTISVLFSEAMDEATAEAAFSILPSVTGAFSWSGSTLTFSPVSALASATSYQVTVGTGAKDLAGNFLASAAVVSFTTSDTIPPQVTGTAPLDGASGVVATALIRATFSETMGHPSAESAFSIVPPVTGSFTWTGPTLTFTPATDLALSRTYTVTLGTGAQDLGGNSLPAPYVFSFTTVGAPAPPTVNITVGSCGASGLEPLLALAILARLRRRRAGTGRLPPAKGGRAKPSVLLR